MKHATKRHKSALALGLVLLLCLFGWVNASSPLETAQALQREAQQQRPNGNIGQVVWQRAAQAAEDAVQAEPSNVAALRLRAVIYDEIKFWTRAESAWRALFALVQDQASDEDKLGFANTLFNIGYDSYRTGKFEEAFRRFEEASEYAPQSARDFVWMGRMALELGNARAAIAHWERAVALEPSKSNTYFLEIARKSLDYGQLAVSSFSQGWRAFETQDFQQALAHFRVATVAAPAFLEAQKMLGRTALELGLADEVIRAYETVVRLEGLTPSSKYNLALAKEIKTFGVAAVKAFHQALELYGAGDKPAALEALTRAVKANPHHQQAWAWLGRLRFESGDYRGAANAYGFALKLNPKDSNSRHWWRLAKSKIK